MSNFFIYLVFKFIYLLELLYTENTSIKLASL
jgi:hypothetical protein